MCQCNANTRFILHFHPWGRSTFNVVERPALVFEDYRNNLECHLFPPPSHVCNSPSATLASSLRASGRLHRVVTFCPQSNPPISSRCSRSSHSIASVVDSEKYPGTHQTKPMFIISDEGIALLKLPSSYRTVQSPGKKSSRIHPSTSSGQQRQHNTLKEMNQTETVSTPLPRW